MEIKFNSDILTANTSKREILNAYTIEYLTNKGKKNENVIRFVTNIGN